MLNIVKICVLIIGWVTVLCLMWLFPPFERISNHNIKVHGIALLLLHQARKYLTTIMIVKWYNFKEIVCLCDHALVLYCRVTYRTLMTSEQSYRLPWSQLRNSDVKQALMERDLLSKRKVRLNL